ncbi:MAG: hypothetical protein ACOCY2_01765 [Guyparkeria sp.]|uniref:hypothetical protein n=1 Tax=Guyparkeria sp. TaxID=2035736 RepID=UPI00397CCA5D
MTDYVLALTHLVEAEGRLLRQQVGRVAAAVVLLGVVALLALAGIGLALAAVYHWVTPFWGAAGGFAVIAGLCLTMGAVFAFWAYRWLR